jgi:hypothetical protein
MNIDRLLSLPLLFAALSCCGPSQQPQQSTSNAVTPSLPAQSAPPAVSNEAQQEATTQPQPRATVDPKSTEAAVEMVKRFATLLEQRKFDAAYMLLGPGAPPRLQFDRSFSGDSDLSVSVGNPADQEGAAGSIYLSVPLTITGTADGKRTSRSATAVMRRVNDVPGSTDAQRRWHIERIDSGDAG